MTRCVNNVEGNSFGGRWAGVANGGVFGQDRDPFFALKIHRVHDSLIYILVIAECTGLPEHGIHEGSFAMVNVGNDGNIA